MHYTLINKKTGEWLHKKSRTNNWTILLATNITTKDKLNAKIWENKKDTKDYLHFIIMDIHYAKTHRNEKSYLSSHNTKECLERVHKREEKWCNKIEKWAKDFEKNYDFEVTTIA